MIRQMVASVLKLCIVILCISSVINEGLLVNITTEKFDMQLETERSPVTTNLTEEISENADVNATVKSEDVERTIIEQVDANSIKNYSSFLSKEPHLAGTKRDEELVDYIKKKWIEFGLDSVKTIPYDVLLSYPDDIRPNKVQIVKENGKVLFTAIHKEQLPEEQNSANIVSSFLGYAPEGDVIADPVYVNFGRMKDFDELERLGIDVRGKICIARYGKTSRGTKVYNGASRGCVGIVLYIDPSQMAMDDDRLSLTLIRGSQKKQRHSRATPLNPRGSVDNGKPNLALWVPGTAIQRGTLFTGRGDPLTPGYPSLPDVYRINISDAGLPKIPAQPIGYDDAKAILRIMGGLNASASWTGGLNIKYKLGPGFNERNAGKKLRLVVSNKYKRKTIHNVIGIIEGAVEPDRYVLLGNHRDSWVYGAVDASSGTAAQMELSRIMGKLRKGGWKPKRTLVFCSWGAEEFGIIGSQEWVEENILKLQHRAVSYLNLDICASGTYFKPESSPLLSSVMKSALKKIPSIKESFETLFDEWMASSKQSDNETSARIPLLTGGTDHMAFAFFAGIPSINFWWNVDKTKHPNISMYPAYHTAYDNFELVNRYLDPGFKIHRSCSALLGALSHRLSDSDLLPFGLDDLANDMQSRLENFQNSDEAARLQGLNITLDGVQKSFADFGEAVEKWKKRTEAETFRNPFVIRQLNDQLMQVERAFILPQGPPSKPLDRHLIYGVSAHNTYAPGFLPGIYDLLYGIDRLEGDERTRRVHELQKLVSDIMIATRNAASILQPLSDI